MHKYPDGSYYMVPVSDPAVCMLCIAKVMKQLAAVGPVRNRAEKPS